MSWSPNSILTFLLRSKSHAVGTLTHIWLWKSLTHNAVLSTALNKTPCNGVVPTPINTVSRNSFEPELYQKPGWILHYSDCYLNNLCHHASFLAQHHISRASKRWLDLCERFSKFFNITMLVSLTEWHDADHGNWILHCFTRLWYVFPWMELPTF